MSYQKWLEKSENQALLRQEEFILGVSEAIWHALDFRGLTKADLAERLSVSRAHVTKLLSGSRNMTLRSLCDITHALDFKCVVDLWSETTQFRSSSIGEANSYRPVKLIALPSANGHLYDSDDCQVFEFQQAA